LTRSTIAFSLLLIIGVAVFHMVVAAPWFGSAKMPDSVDRILMLLAGALTSITGFYFGSKASTEGQAAGAAQTAAASTPASDTAAAGSLTLDPPQGKVGDVVSITGAGFGVSRGIVMFGSTQAADQDVVAWTDTLIKLKVPTGARPGQMNIIVTKADGHQVSTPPTAFTVAA
jgi:hypothetical protein